MKKHIYPSNTVTNRSARMYEKKIIKITDFGANTESEDNSEYIQNAINSLPNGGTIIIPSGTYVTGAFYLNSNITMTLEEGAILKAHKDLSKYRRNGYFDSFGKETTSLIIAQNAVNISICGKGTIELVGNSFMENGNQTSSSPLVPKKRPTRPIFFDKCKNVFIKDITVKNSPCWTFTMHNCSNVKITGISVFNNARIPHNDGIHLSACKNVSIGNCILKCGDDCIAITSLFDYSLTSDNISISNCVMSSSSAALRIGHISSRVSNVCANGLTINNTNRGIAVFAAKNGSVENVGISNVTASTKLFDGGWWGKGEPIVICTYNSNGIIKNVNISNFVSESENSVIIAGKNIENVNFENCKFNVNNKYNEEFFELCPNGFAPKDKKRINKIIKLSENNG